MAIDSAKLINLAARGIPQTAIAKALGITDGAVSQLLARDDVLAKVRDKESELASQDLEAITSLEKINHSLLGKIGDLVQDTESLGEAVGAFERLTKLQNQKRSGGVETEDGIRKISMGTPVFIQQNIQINTSSQNEIIDINSNPMATMPTLNVHKLIKDAKGVADEKNKNRTNNPKDSNLINLDTVNF